MTSPHIHDYLAMGFPPLYAGAPPANAGPADARSSSVETGPAEKIEEAKMTAVAADTPAAAETAIAADTPAPAPDDQAPAATTQARQAFNPWSLLEGVSAEKTAVAADTPGPAPAAQAPAAAAPASADAFDIATPHDSVEDSNIPVIASHHFSRGQSSREFWQV